jgi:predicted NUDIX family NTP pyrophosphohydrolase
MYRRTDRGVEVLLAHPGGPFWEGRHEGAWTIPKGGIHEGEPALETAQREFREETGFDACGPFVELGHVVQRSGKVVFAWAFEGDCDPAALVSMETTVEWPSRSGRRIVVPEIDRVQFFTIDEARDLINRAQAELLDRLVHALAP